MKTCIVCVLRIKLQAYMTSLITAALLLLTMRIHGWRVVSEESLGPSGEIPSARKLPANALPIIPALEGIDHAACSKLKTP